MFIADSMILYIIHRMISSTNLEQKREIFSHDRFNIKRFKTKRGFDYLIVTICHAFN